MRPDNYNLVGVSDGLSCQQNWAVVSSRNSTKPTE